MKYAVQVSTLVLALASSLDAQDSPRPRPSRPIPPPTPGEIISVVIDRHECPQPIRVTATWLPPDGETTTYHYNSFFASSGMGPGDHAVTEMAYGPCDMTNNPPQAADQCIYGGEIMDVDLPQRTANGAAAFALPYQTRRLLFTIKDLGGQLCKRWNYDWSYPWSDIGVFAAPTLRRRPSVGVGGTE